MYIITKQEAATYILVPHRSSGDRFPLGRKVHHINNFSLNININTTVKFI